MFRRVFVRRDVGHSDGSSVCLTKSSMTKLQRSAYSNAAVRTVRPSLDAAYMRLSVESPILAVLSTLISDCTSITAGRPPVRPLRCRPVSPRSTWSGSAAARQGNKVHVTARAGQLLGSSDRRSQPSHDSTQWMFDRRHVTSLFVVHTHPLTTAAAATGASISTTFR